MPKVTYKCVDCGKERTAYQSQFNGVDEHNYRCRDCALIKYHIDNPSKIVTYVCVDCGRIRTDFIRHFNGILEENYRCHECSVKYRYRNHISKKVIYKCIDCGKKRTGYKSEFNNRDAKTYRCRKCANKIIAQKQNKHITYKCVDCGKEHTARPSDFKQIKEEYRCYDCAMKKLHADPVWLENNKRANAKKLETPEYREHLIEWAHNTHKIRSTHPTWNLHQAESTKILAKDPNWIKNNKITLNKIHNDLEIQRKIAESNRDRVDDPIYRERLLISITGEGIWYGNKSLIRWNNGSYRKYYCALWNKNLWDRIDAAYDYRSILSGKTRFENYNQESLTHHHLYWQEKACCEWDEDANGYYAWINNGTITTPEWIKYYIKGDPNKFVLLTRDEHGKIRGNKKEGTDKIYYIKLMENLIEERAKEGKKCYLSKEEYEVYKVEHADIIEKYKKK
jgi:DNA-directed RNA polymerase subunit RPC12/RpoP